MEDVIFINQSTYIKDLFNCFNMETYKPTETPMSASMKMDANEKGVSIDIIKYRGMIDSLLYLTTSRSDIMFSIYLYARY